MTSCERGEGFTPIGAILDQLGVIGYLDEHEMVTDAMVVLRISSFDDSGDKVSVSFSDNTGYIVQRGMIETARDFIEMASPALQDDEG